jgi:hypothetical protein
MLAAGEVELRAQQSKLFGGSGEAESLAGLLDRRDVGMQRAGDVRVGTVGGPPHFELDDGGGAEPGALLEGQVQRAHGGVRRQLTPTVETDWTLVVLGPGGRKPALLVAAKPAHLDAAIAACPAYGRFWLAHGHWVLTHGGRKLRGHFVPPNRGGAVGVGVAAGSGDAGGIGEADGIGDAAGKGDDRPEVTVSGMDATFPDSLS